MTNETVPDYDVAFAAKPGEIIVGSPHLRPLLAKLGTLSVPYDVPEPSPELGLTRLRLTDVQQAVSSITDEVKRRLDRDPKPGKDLDKVLHGLRALFAADNSGWRPLMGKNRVVGHVRGVGEVSYGGEQSPRPVESPLDPPVRASGPGRGVRVGVLDTRLAPHSWLAGAWAARYSDRIGTTGPYAAGHATFVAGLVLSQAPGAVVDVRSVLDESGGADSWSVATEIVRFARTGLDVLNLSFVCYTEDGQAPMVLSAAMDRLDPDLVVVAAAGNHGNATGTGQSSKSIEALQRRPAWPAALDDVLAVGACDDDGRPAAFTPKAPWVDVLAAGVDLRSTYLEQALLRDGKREKRVDFGGYAKWSGTSFSAALVSGTIAAGTEPGRVSASAALQNILASLPRSEAATLAELRPPCLPDLRGL